MTMREEFEAWLVDTFGPNYKAVRNWAEIEAMFQAWQAAYRAGQVSVEAERDALLNGKICSHQGFAGPSACIRPLGHAGRHEYGDITALDSGRLLRMLEEVRAERDALRNALIKIRDSFYLSGDLARDIADRALARKQP